MNQKPKIMQIRRSKINTIILGPNLKCDVYEPVGYDAIKMSTISYESTKNSSLKGLNDNDCKEEASRQVINYLLCTLIKVNGEKKDAEFYNNLSFTETMELLDSVTSFMGKIKI